MNTTNPSTPTQVEYRILELIEQLVSVVSKGTALGLSDLASAMFSGYFIESGGVVTPAIETFLRQKIEAAEERAARTRRGAKALTYGSYNLKELMNKLEDIIKAEGLWKSKVIQGFRRHSHVNRYLPRRADSSACGVGVRGTRLRRQFVPFARVWR